MKRHYLTAAVCLQLCAGWAQSQTAVNTLSDVEKAQGFSLLFDGTLESFKTHFVDYIRGNTTNTNLSSEWAVNAEKAVGIQNRTEDIRSKKIFKDFDLRLDYRCDANQGVFYRTLVNTDRAWQTGIEVAINNYTNQNKDAPGAAYDLYPPNPNTYYLHNSQKWNQLRIVAKADSIEHWMNGTKVVGFKLHSPGFWTAYAASKWNTAKTLTFKVPGNQAAGYIEQGYLGFQADHGGKWEIRNLKISESPCHGPINTVRTTTECVTSGIGGDQIAAEGWLAKASLRRAGGGLALDLGEDAAGGEALLAALDGRTWSAGIPSGARGVAFAGSFKPGLYVVRIRSAAGEAVRKLNLL